MSAEKRLRVLQAQLRIEQVAALYRKLNAASDALEKLTGCNMDSPLLLAMWQLFDAQVDAVSELLGDSHGWLSWFIWENGCGRKKLAVRHPGQPLRRIATPADLARHMEVAA